MGRPDPVLRQVAVEPLAGGLEPVERPRERVTDGVEGEDPVADVVQRILLAELSLRVYLNRGLRCGWRRGLS